MALSYDAIKQLWIQAGGPPDAADTAAAITMPESSANPANVQQGQPYATTGWGLWQITPGNSVPSVGINQALLDPLTNARAAVAKFRAAGNSFSPWTTYVDGKYKQFLQGADWAGGTASTAASVASFTTVQTAGFFDWFSKAFTWLTSPFGAPGAPSDPLAPGGGIGSSGTLGSISAIGADINEFFKMISLLFDPKFWLRVGAFFVGLVLLIGGAVALISSVKAS